MFSVTSFIAQRFLSFKKKNRSVSFMITLCFTGIAIGTFALMLTLIIMNGFEKTIHKKMQGITSQVIIQAPGNKIDDEAIKRFLKTHFSSTVKAASSNSMRQVLLDKDNQQTVMFIKGIEPETEAQVSSIEEKILFPFKKDNQGLLPQTIKNNKILIGYKMAAAHNLAVGDEVTILIPEPTSKKKVILRKRRTSIGGIYKIGLAEYDNSFGYVDLRFLKDLFKEQHGVDSLCLTLHEPSMNNWFDYIWYKMITPFWPFGDYHESIITDLQENLPGMIVSSWQSLYPALVSSLRLEKYVMFFILALITLVASMNMISLLFMQIQQKRRDIAIMRAMGIGYKKIRTIFMRIGLYLTMSASLVGLAFAGILGYFLEHYPFIELPDVYYVSHLPAKVEPALFVIVFVCTVILGFIATWIPTRATKHINITQVLRQE